MRAAQVTRYGSIAVGDVAKPTPAAGEVLVRVHATSVNAVDWYGFNGRPYVARAADGLAEAEVERARRRLRRRGRGGRRRRRRTSSPATRYTAATAARSRSTSSRTPVVERKPANLSFEEAAAVPRRGAHRAAGPARSRRRAARAAASSSTARPAASARSRCRSRRRSARRCTPSAARATSSRHDSSAPIASSTTRAKTSRAAAPATTSCSTTRATGHGVRCDACSRRTATVVLVGGPRQQRLLGPLGHIVRIKLAAKLGGRTAVVLHREAEPRRSGRAPRADRIGAGAAGDRAALRARADRGGDARDGRRTRTRKDRRDDLMEPALDTNAYNASISNPQPTGGGFSMDRKLRVPRIRVVVLIAGLAAIAAGVAWAAIPNGNGVITACVHKSTGRSA